MTTQVTTSGNETRIIQTVQTVGSGTGAAVTGPAGPGVPAGGTAGQIITKTSAADYDTDWSDPAAPVGAGDMVAATYDPTGVNDDAFDRSNHGGTQAIATVAGLQTALDAGGAAAAAAQTAADAAQTDADAAGVLAGAAQTVANDAQTDAAAAGTAAAAAQTAANDAQTDATAAGMAAAAAQTTADSAQSDATAAGSAAVTAQTAAAAAQSDATTSLAANAANAAAIAANVAAMPDELIDLDTTVTGAELDAVKAKVDGIEAGATGDQTGAEIKAAYEGQADTNAYTDVDQAKLAGLNGVPAGGTLGQILAKNSVTDHDTDWIDPPAGGAVVDELIDLDTTVTGPELNALKAKVDGSEASATADQTGAEIKAAYEAEADTNAYTDAEKTKLGGVEDSATADQTGAEIKAAYEAEADTNAYTDAEKTKLAGLNGVPAGGTTDQILAKASATDHDLKWADASSGGIAISIAAETLPTQTLAADGELIIVNGGDTRQVVLPAPPAPHNDPLHVRVGYDSLTFDASGALDPSGAGLMTLSTADGKTIHGVTSFVLRQPVVLDCVLMPGATDWVLMGFSDALNPTGWVIPVLLNGFTDVLNTVSGFDFLPFAYRRDSSGDVVFRGAIAGTTTNVEIFTLAAGFVPRERVNMGGFGKSTGGGQVITNVLVDSVNAAAAGEVIVSNRSPSTFSYINFTAQRFSVL